MIGVLSADVKAKDAVSSPSVGSTLHDALKSATRDVHERLHRHTGFAALQNDTIDLATYEALLRRLYGFYSVIEGLISSPPVRTEWLKTDLLALGLKRSEIETLPRCTYRPTVVTKPHLFGTLYVVEGSALGGRALARHLDTIVGIGAEDGRRFFLGHGALTGKAWREFLARLAELPADAETRSRCVTSALETFVALDSWLEGWLSASTEQPRAQG